MKTPEKINTICNILRVIFLLGTLIVAILGLREVKRISVELDEVRASKVISPVYVIGNETDGRCFYFNGTYTIFGSCEEIR